MSAPEGRCLGREPAGEREHQGGRGVADDDGVSQDDGRGDGGCVVGVERARRRSREATTSSNMREEGLRLLFLSGFGCAVHKQ